MIALGLSILAIVLALATMLTARRRVRQAYVAGYAAAGARLFGVVAAELGHDATLLDKMLVSYGRGAPDDVVP